LYDVVYLSKEALNIQNYLKKIKGAKCWNVQSLPFKKTSSHSFN